MPQHNGFVGGQWNACCDICGRVFKSAELRKAWDSSMRCDACYENRHPQDFVRAIEEDIAAPWARAWNPQFVIQPELWINNALEGVLWVNNANVVVFWQP